jgi:hypothetical protein
VTGQAPERLFARNDRNLTAAFDRRHKVVGTPADAGPTRFALYDRAADPGETSDLARSRPDEARTWRRELELFVERSDRERARVKELTGEAPAAAPLDPVTCASIKALGYVDARCPN